LENFPGVVITVSHDRYFLDKVVDELIVFEGEGKVSHFYGNYSEYIADLNTKKQSAKPKKQTEQAERKKKEKKRLEYRKEEGSNIEAVQDLYAEQQALESELEEKMERWETLSLLVESFETK